MSHRWATSGAALGRTTRARRTSRLGWVLAACLLEALAVAYGAWAWNLVFVERVGPVVAVIDSSGGRGVHSGDLLSLPLLACATMCLLAAGACLARVQPVAMRVRRGRVVAAPPTPVIHIPSVLPVR